MVRRKSTCPGRDIWEVFNRVMIIHKMVERLAILQPVAAKAVPAAAMAVWAGIPVMLMLTQLMEMYRTLMIWEVAVVVAYTITILV